MSKFLSVQLHNMKLCDFLDKLLFSTIFWCPNHENGLVKPERFF